jgi:hypothetical protein
MAKASEKVGGWLDTIEARWSLWTLINGSGLIAFIGFPAWAVRTAQIFAEYAPFSWVAAGILGALTWAIIRLLWQLANRIRVRSKYDEYFVERNRDFNPLETTFERKRIYVDDLVLPSHPFVDGKTFVDCDIIGPANIYFASGNSIPVLKPPVFDMVCLDPTKRFWNGFIFSNCIFRNCSFQRITGFASTETYVLWKDITSVNWISPPPSADMLAIGRAQLDTTAIKEPEPPKQIENKASVSSN